MEALRIVDGKVYRADDGELLGDLDHVDQETNLVYIRAPEPADLEKAVLALNKAVIEKTVSYQIVNQGKRPKRNAKCPEHPKVKWKRCPCSKKDYNVNLVEHRK